MKDIREMTTVEQYLRYYEICDEICRIEVTAINPLKTERKNILNQLAQHYGWSEETQAANTNTKLLDMVVFEAGKLEIQKLKATGSLPVGSNEDS